ncbi:HalOD1 output domain-containing protein [Halomarina salina]|uniref:HalOD1 output domain-containing protein n=1 Tax=Halomarina salina TaxID=1872699 RepID=A0ABD5RNW8_9EURY|nr:HalOD1 output domain-containing protein [Halomarina salina]
MREGEPWSLATVRAVGEATGRDPLHLPEALYDVMDPDALDGLFVAAGTPVNGSGCVSFEFCGCAVTVYSDRTVVVARLHPE